MAAGYDPYQQNFQWGSAIGDIGGNILKILMLLGGGGKGPLKGLEGLLGMGGKEDEKASPDVITTGGGHPPPQIQQPMPMPTGAPMGPMPGAPGPGGPQQGPMGQDPNQIMQMIMALLQQNRGGQGGPPMGGMMG